MSVKYSRTNPLMASIKERYLLCRPGTPKETVHIEIDLADSGMEYEVGDSIAVLPTNDLSLVQEIVGLLGVSGKEIINDPKTGEKIQLRDYLATKANLRDCTRKFVGEICERQNVAEKKLHLEQILESGSSENFKDFQNTNDVLDALDDNKEVSFELQEFCDLLKPIMPRFYSISSSQKAVGNEVHLTVALQKWRSQGRERLGVCTHYLCDMAPLNLPFVPIYVHPHRGFTLPSDSNAPIIMVGPGTGVAPFRAFMQEREVLGSTGKNWLFFGEWNRAHHYFYEDYWTSLQKKGKMRVDLAFSRDQDDKIYVQHRMQENGKELYQWLQDGAYLFVCGDASQMAKDVDAALHNIVKEHGCFTDDQAKAFIKGLRKENRYLKDVY